MGTGDWWDREEGICIVRQIKIYGDIRHIKNKYCSN